MTNSIHYSDYLQLDKILHAQEPESVRRGKPAHDEMLFIVTHQAYELWFRQLLYEIESVAAILGKPAVNDQSPELQTVVHRLERMLVILRLMVQQIDVMETMTAMDFLDFRDFLRPASGFQSWQFKVLEARLGLRYEERYGQGYYLSQLRPEEIGLIREAEEKPSVRLLVNGWLERMPFLQEEELWSDFPAPAAAETLQAYPDPFFAHYRDAYFQSLSEGEANNRLRFEETFGDQHSSGRAFSPRASRSALFIMLYRGYPMLQLPYRLLQVLLELDEQLSTWRFRHMSMVQRMIGSRVGTGGSTGKDYLRSALEKHAIFSELAGLTSFLIERNRLPELGRRMQVRLGFAAAGSNL